ncbi:signal peptidase I [Sulfidibacter corallicola]|uniref:Signal peptidase I n=1 Tax=Sulfidibacter corallicola TaxID=2818388 RepID=A0A8A4TNS8_SULCO|nr:signal peptidase I [Sulfidibacter corallicola]QTD51629.1 signal peptidase I [Sulfidibacter corallicola]
MAKKSKSKKAAETVQAEAETNKQEEEKDPSQSKDLFRELAELALFGFCLVVFFKTFVWQNFQIPTPSMENSLLIGDHITANTFMFKGGTEIEKKLFPFRDIVRGDVVVFKWPGDDRQDWIKRCIGLPGDRFEIIAERVYINGEILGEDYTYYKKPSIGTDRDASIGYRPKGYYEMKPGLEHAEYIKPNENSYTLREIKDATVQYLSRFRTQDPETFDRVIARLKAAEPDVIPEGFYIMMGDNRNRSFDSRKWGLVPKEFVHGRGYLVWWSYGEDEGSHEAKGFSLIWSYVRVVFEFHKRTHWDESFELIK